MPDDQRPKQIYLRGQEKTLCKAKVSSTVPKQGAK